MAKVQNGTAVVTETINGNLVVVREKVTDKNGRQLVTQDGRNYYNYIVRGVIMGEKREIRLAPKDKGGYEPLEIIFSISDKAELVISDVTEEMNGVKRTRTVYTAQVVDEDGELWKCDLKPERDSAKTLLNFLLIMLKKQQAKDKAKETTETAA